MKEKNRQTEFLNQEAIIKEKKSNLTNTSVVNAPTSTHDVNNNASQTTANSVSPFDSDKALPIMNTMTGL
ncbi:hypothetical protein [Desulfopila sp. IMCC35008]|uniref:hypothetical protein n=1 Tax=Desulfopila sp. IMCC35008 TaxID=2653858 RepID=UPI0013D492B4|nr:hypothetical protein [Desulfopila sp. IMCC35008]